jgi:hypothetical protein
MTSSKAFKRITAVIEAYTELSLMLFGGLSILVMLVFPFRLDIRLLLGGFGFYLVAAGLVAKLVSRKKLA